MNSARRPERLAPSYGPSACLAVARGIGYVLKAINVRPSNPRRGMRLLHMAKINRDAEPVFA